MMGTMIFEEAVVLVSIRRKSKAVDWEPPHFNDAPPHNSFFIIIINQHSVQQKNLNLSSTKLPIKVHPSMKQTPNITRRGSQEYSQRVQ
jgi:hypothetical protein